MSSRRLSNASSVYDIVIVGGGHNGLVSAAYLAKAGYKTAVYERRGILGGAATTEEIHDGHCRAQVWVCKLHKRAPRNTSTAILGSATLQDSFVLRSSPI